ncbi:MAG: carboxypeptidase regulatory-like domain-containing protein [Anaerolineae bacterium]|nr:carboxypeptidase regulatory-like domain-containing protein [Anaerolineae bacterium]
MKKSFVYFQIRLLVTGLVLLGVVFSALSWPAPAGASQVYVLDNFESALYTNQNGTANWAGDWIETNDTGGAGSGDVQITGGALRIGNTVDGGFESIERSVNIPAANVEVTLSYSHTDANLEAGDTLVLEVYDGDTTIWTTLETFDGNTANVVRAYNLTPYRSSDTRIRFRTTAGFTGATEFFYADDVRITYWTTSTHVASSVFQTVQTYYVPVPEDQGLLALDTINAAANDPMYSYVSVTVVTDGTAIYFDHWEDGFETKTTNPAQSTSEVWGDNNPANGVAPGYTTDVFNAGDIVILQSLVPSTDLARIDFDGGDKISSTDAIAVTRTSWPSDAGTLHGGSVEMLNTDIWGTRYDIPADSGDQANDFDYAALSVMASQNTTQIFRTPFGSTTPALITTLNEGESYLFNDGTINRGDQITADKPIQAQFLTGDIGSNYESSWFTLYPFALLSSDYYAPVNATSTIATAVYIYNPNTTAITVKRADSSGALADLPSIAARTAYRDLMPTAATGVRYYTEPISGIAPKFQAISNINSGGQANDWGYTLIPGNQLTQQAQLGWGVGRDPTSFTNPSENGSPAWVLAVGTGTMNICADYDGDGLGALTDANGSRYDQLLTLTNLQRAQVFDTDGDQTGMLLYLCNGSESANSRSNKIAVAWGQAPGIASNSAPGLDVGTSVPPLPNYTAIKNAVLTNDLNGDGKFDIGDTFEYQIKINNVGALPIPGNLITVKDIIPTYTNYFPNSTKIDGISIPDAASGTPFPLDDLGYLIPSTLNLDSYFLVTFRVTIDASIPAATTVQNNAQVSGLNLTYIPKVEIFIDPPTKIGDFIWLDQDGDGVQDAGEPGLAGVTVFLDTNNNGIWNAGEPTTTTNSSGQYTFSGLSDGTYYVVVDTSTLPGGLTQTGDPDSACPGAGCNSRHTVTIGPGSTNKPYYLADFGYRGSGSIGDFVWYDVDRDGIQDGGAEVGLDGVAVNLTWAGKDGNLATTADNIVFPAKATSGGGAYSFTGLPYGVYQADLDETTLPSNYSITNIGALYADPMTRTLSPGTPSATDVDYGAAPGATISDRVWNDLDGDGVQDAGEGGISGVRVYIDADNDNTYDVGERFATTDSNGNYAITNLPPGTYAVRVDTTSLPAGSTQTYDLSAPTNDHEASVTVAAGEVRTDIDFGYQLGVLSIAKSSSAGGNIQPGNTITYTLLVRNNSGQNQTGVSITDVLPRGTTYVPQSTMIVPQNSYTVRDEFSTQLYNNNNGSSNWATNWVENDPYGTAGPIGNYVGVAGDGRLFLYYAYPSYERIERSVNLASASSATLSFDWQTISLDGGQLAAVRVSTDGTNFTTLATYDGSQSGSASINLGSYLASNTIIRFEAGPGTPNWQTGDYFYIDNVQIEYAGSATTKDNIPGGSYPDLTNGAPPALLVSTDAFDLLPGEQLTLIYQIEVDDPVALSSIDNTAVVSSAQQLTPQYASVSDSLPRSSVGDFVWYDLNSDGVQGGGEPGLANVTVTLIGRDADGNDVRHGLATVQCTTGIAARQP